MSHVLLTAEQANHSGEANEMVQEPVALMEVFSGWDDVAIIDVLTDSASKLPDGEYKLYAAPVRTKDLTDDEISDAIFGKGSLLRLHDHNIRDYRAVIAADRDKNK